MGVIKAKKAVAAKIILTAKIQVWEFVLQTKSTLKLSGLIKNRQSGTERFCPSIN